MKIDRRLRGFTLIEVITVIVIIALLSLVLLPAMIRAKRQRLQKGCVNNLKQVGLAFRLWSGDSGDQYSMAYSTNEHGTKEYIYTGDVFRHFQIMSNELMTPDVLACPADNRLPAKSFALLSNSNVSYFVSVDAIETSPQMMLSGDRNIVVNGSPATPGLLILKSNDVVSWGTNIHNGQGSVGFADGSVQVVTSAGLTTINASAVRNSGTNLSRLAIP
jgi:prepilin-type N-terminal cleavage/methylation domain-containing protein/prepilin-type processing-associated H-X9-DG protein